VAVGFTSLLVNEALSIGEKEANAREARSSPGGYTTSSWGKPSPTSLHTSCPWRPGSGQERTPKRAQKRSAIISLRLSRNS
jgi:hypothetical protein